MLIRALKMGEMRKRKLIILARDQADIAVDVSEHADRLPYIYITEPDQTVCFCIGVNIAAVILNPEGMHLQIVLLCKLKSDGSL